MTTLGKIILRCKEANACKPEFEKLVACQSLNEAWVVLIKNMWWVFSNNILDIEDWRELLKAGIDCTANYNCAICMASDNGHLEVVELLLKHGADCTMRGNYAIRAASANGHLEVVKLLLEHGADCMAYGNSTIRRASYFRHTEVVELLKQHGATL